MFEFNIKHIGNRETFYKTMPPPPPTHTHLAQSKHFEHNCIFVNDILYQNVLFVVFCARGWGWMRLSKSSKTNKWAQLYYLQCIKAMGIYCICMFYLNEQTICPKVYTYNAYKYTVQNMFPNF